MSIFNATIIWQNAATVPIKADSPGQAKAIAEALGDMLLARLSKNYISDSIEVEVDGFECIDPNLLLHDGPVVRRLWDMLGATPVDDDGCIQEPYLDFPVGTHREDIWHWFEETLGASVPDLMNLEEEEDA